MVKEEELKIEAEQEGMRIDDLKAKGGRPDNIIARLQQGQQMMSKVLAGKHKQKRRNPPGSSKFDSVFGFNSSLALPKLGS